MLFSDGNNFKYIEKCVFEIFFKNNNTLKITNDPLKCSDINEFAWILRQRDQLENYLSVECSDGRNLWNLGLNFLIKYPYSICTAAGLYY
jgi:hypothetical protein